MEYEFWKFQYFEKKTKKTRIPNHKLVKTAHNSTLMTVHKCSTQYITDQFVIVMEADSTAPYVKH